MIPDRLIYRRAGGRQISDLLAMLFAAELLAPSRRLWLVSPWISNLVVLDNRADQFVSLQPAWSRTNVSLATVLAQLAAAGTNIRVVTRSDPHNKAFRTELARLAEASGAVVPVLVRDKLHAKGLITDRFALWGSMNFTNNGVDVNDECVQFTTDRTKMAQLVTEFGAAYPEAAS
jgi:phosphatidylserine/phosphatidylglycerophosphate/cardiolipin synthase-like enzyme